MIPRRGTPEFAVWFEQYKHPCIPEHEYLTASAAADAIANGSPRLEGEQWSIEYRGVRLLVGRTTLLDNVATYWPEADLARYEPVFGARVYQDRFHAIDSVSDG